MAHVKCRKKKPRLQGGECFWRWEIPYMVWFRFNTLLRVLAKTGIRPKHLEFGFDMAIWPTVSHLLPADPDLALERPIS